MAAQNQHYVPKFVLRNFLSEESKERVSVYDKKDDRTFTTSINNIMAERRFNDFQFDEYIVSFELIASKIEGTVLPRYRAIVQAQTLERTPEERADLAFFIAFQFLRVKAMREMYVDLEEAVKKNWKAGATA